MGTRLLHVTDQTVEDGTQGQQTAPLAVSDLEGYQPIPDATGYPGTVSAQPEIDRNSYAYRFGELSMAARLYLLLPNSKHERNELVRLVNAAFGPEVFKPIEVSK